LGIRERFVRKKELASWVEKVIIIRVKNNQRMVNGRLFKIHFFEDIEKEKAKEEIINRSSHNKLLKTLNL